MVWVRVRVRVSVRVWVRVRVGCFAFGYGGRSGVWKWHVRNAFAQPIALVCVCL